LLSSFELAPEDLAADIEKAFPLLSHVNAIGQTKTAEV
jgi:hypothetical protein